MKVGASYYPELHTRSEWESDLENGRRIGLQALRCGEFAWDYLEPADGEFHFDWIWEFLDLAHAKGYRVIWCTPSATPPPRFFRRWPDLHAVNSSGMVMPTGVRRNYTPNHPGYLERCAEIARRLGGALKDHPAIAGWQIDNELAGDGFCCWGGRWTLEGFREYLQGKFGSTDALNELTGGGVWGENYHDWEEIPIPGPVVAGAFPPGLRLEFQRYRSEMWRNFYSVQYQALKESGAGQPVTTNFYNLNWNIPFDLYRWQPELDSIGLSHYLEGENETAFQFALMRSVGGTHRPFWVLEQKAGQQCGQNFFPDHTRERLVAHLRRCRAAGAEYAIYWHLRQHTHGCEQEHGAVLNHDGRIGRIGEVIRQAVIESEHVAVRRSSGVGVVFDFEQQWAQELRPGHLHWDYRTELQDHFFAALGELYGEVELLSKTEVGGSWKILAVPRFQMDLGVTPQLLEAASAGATVILSADYGRLDRYNSMRPRPLLDTLRPMLPIPDLELLQLGEQADFTSCDGLAGRHFFVVPFGTAEPETGAYPSHLTYEYGKGRVVILMSAFAKDDLVRLFRQCGGRGRF